MTKNNGFKVAALAASIALAMGSTAVMAADVGTTQLPGVGTGTAGISAGTITAGEQTITVTGTDQVINWGKAGGTINATGTGAQPAGFNIGSGAKLHFSSAAAAAVLNIDSSGNPSQILGTLDSTGVGATSIFVANTNGIVVGSAAKITSTGHIGLIANTLDTTPTFDGTAANGGFVYNGTGGDVTVQPGATIGGTGATVFIAGGGNVNVDLGAVTGTTTLSAGQNSGGTFSASNTSANLTVTGGATAAKTVASLGSAGTATTNGMLIATASNVAGVLTNTGELTLPATGTSGVVNQGQLHAAAGSTFKSLSNEGAVDFAGAGGVTISTGGSLTNTGSITNAAAISVAGGNLTNGGSIKGATGVTIAGGNLNNTGSIANTGAVTVTNGAVDNGGTLSATNVTTGSDSTLASFTAGGQYYINNTGTITADTTAGNLTIDANKTTRDTATKNDSTGSFTNTGMVQLGADPLAAGALIINANNAISLGGSVQQITAVGTPNTYKAVSSTNQLASVALTATKGAVTVSTPVAFSGTSTITGAQVKLMDNVTSGTASTPTGTLTITAGNAPTDDYSVRVAGGKTVSAATVNVLNATGKSASTILQGTLAGDAITFGATGAGNGVGDIISGPAGTIKAGTSLKVNFTGRLKTAPYLNNANNFRYNYLPVTYTGAGTGLALTLNPTDYTTNGTSNGKSGVNVLVNGSVALTGPTYVTPATSAVTGVTNTPNTHLVLQSTGNIATGANFYWPGYVYLGTIDKDGSGNALPGTLSTAGKITLGGDFSNQLPGDVAGASGIHFMSNNLVGGAHTVYTNANAWINFPTDLQTQVYTQGIVTDPTFSAGTATGLIVNYAPFTVGQTQKLFNTHPVDSTK